MKPRDVFQIAVRVVGLITVILGVGSITEAILYQGGLASTEGFSARYWAIRGVIEIGVGLLLLRGAKLIVEFAYRGTDEPSACNQISN